jgi:hypothetical protein
MWMLPPMSEAAARELEGCWTRLWADSETKVKSVFASTDTTVLENGLGPDFDSAMLTTMTFEEMSTHLGGEMYTDMILKPKS